MTEMQTLFDYTAQIALVFSVAFYLVEAYMGYRCIKVLIAIVGFFLGFMIGFMVTMRFYLQDAYLPTVIGLLAGILLAIVAFRLYLIGVFIFCGATAAGAAAQLPILQDNTVLQIIMWVAVFVIVGILAVKFSKMCIIVITAVTGAVSAGNLLCTPFPVMESNFLIRIAVIAVIAISGILVQKLTAK